MIARLSEIQTLLISKITVDPMSYDSYFHLGGTALILARQIAHTPNLALTSMTEDLGVIAKPLIQTALRYAQDVSPGDSRTAELQGYWVEARKY